MISTLVSVTLKAITAPSAVPKGPEAGPDVVVGQADHGEVGEPVAPIHDGHDVTVGGLWGARRRDPVVEALEVPFGGG
jgi:hypothetical protein